MFREQKRFIAGVVCPKCAAMDKIVAYNQEGENYRECVACGFIDQLFARANAPLPDTRVSKSTRRDNIVAEPITVIHLKT